mgnify:CR=1 FL=1
MDDKIDSILNNNYIFVALTTFAAIFCSQSRVKLPGFIRNLFENSIFRVVFLSLLLVIRFDNTPHVAFIVALLFVMVMHHISNLEIKENFAYVENFNASIKKLNA